MDKLSKKEAIKLFREQWNIIADKCCTKKEALKIMKWGKNVKHNCFLCEYAYSKEKFYMCTLCPIGWPKITNNFYCEHCLDSYYKIYTSTIDKAIKYNDSNAIIIIKTIAKIIANLSEKD